MGSPFSCGQPAPGKFHGIAHTGIYLFLHGPVTGPPTGHNLLLMKKYCSYQNIRIFATKTVESCVC
jgi:hypothetical protein